MPIDDGVKGQGHTDTFNQCLIVTQDLILSEDKGGKTIMHFGVKG